MGGVNLTVSDTASVPVPSVVSWDAELKTR
jgi:hypothetical protein